LLIEKTIEFCLGLLAACIQAADINRVWIEEGKVHKCRRWWGWVLILIGNPVLVFRQVPVRVLYSKQWVRWEREVKHALNGEAVPSGRVLVCDQLPGVPLADWLAESGQTKDAQLEVLKIAVESLQDFHRQQVDDGRGNKIPLSHGDAALTNILLDAENHSAQWIDFDVRHWLSIPAPKRHADDLRAFLFSAARPLSEEAVPEFLSMAQRQYDDGEVWDCLKDQLTSAWFRFDAFHLAQIQRSKSVQVPTKGLDLKWAKLTELILAEVD